MKINIEQASQILNKTIDEVLFIVQDGRLNAVLEKDNDMIFNEDGTVRFLDNENTKLDWEFDLDDLLSFKKKYLDNDLDGKIKQIMSD